MIWQLMLTELESDTITSAAYHTACLSALLYCTKPTFSPPKSNTLKPGLVEKLLTYCLQKADVFSQGAHAATEGEDEHEDPYDHQHHSGVH